MKNLAVFTVLALVLAVFVVPAAADWHPGPHGECAVEGKHFHSIRWYRNLSRRDAVVSADDNTAETKPSTQEEDTVSLEMTRVFIEKGLRVASFTEVPTFLAKIEIFNHEKLKCFNYGRYGYGRRQCYLVVEKIVYVRVEYKESGVPIAVGQGDDDDIRHAAEEAAEEVAEKIKKAAGTGLSDYSVYIL